MLSKPFARLLVAVPAATLMFGAATAQTGTMTNPTTQGATSAGASANALSATERKFITDAAMGGMAEVRLGELASQNAASSEVREYGNHMVADHTKANQELMALAKSKGVTPPQELDATHKQAVEKLSAMKGAAFDKAFMSQMVADHRKTVALFKTAASGAKDPEIKAFATKTLPTLESHLSMAQTTAKTAGKGSAS